jgi:hypothetical protein
MNTAERFAKPVWPVKGQGVGSFPRAETATFATLLCATGMYWLVIGIGNSGQFHWRMKQAAHCSQI